MNSILVYTYPLSAVLIFALAIGVGLFLTHKFHLSWRLYWIGGAIFILSQVFHLPFNFLLLNPFLQHTLPEKLPAAWVLPVTALILGLSAGSFEELARWAGYRWWVKDARSWSRGLLYGAGHGGVEALLLGGLVLVTYINMVAIRNQDLATLV
ncbi:MAG TPA: YhfC family glutamic-type intramembrane protease, partial [Anaerolineales bacterium]|nr:YhfC family glutamic-type intramembrane protease [Anaerolineales bacterium]